MGVEGGVGGADFDGSAPLPPPILSPQPLAPNPKPQTLNPITLNPKPETRNPKLLNPITLNPKPRGPLKSDRKFGLTDVVLQPTSKLTANEDSRVPSPGCRV